MQTGNFGKVREAYAQARQLFPAEVFDYLWSQVTADSPYVLDLGCGTGIATRQLAERSKATIIGCDVDEEMIEEARQTSPEIPYFVAPANRLPFEARSFDMVTAFSAFHWFCDDKSLADIKRALKPDGMFGVINKNDVGGFRVGYREKLEQLLGRKLASPKQNYNPTEILREAEFTNVTEKSFKTEEIFDPAGALQHIQSASVWAEIPPVKYDDALQTMQEHISSHTIDGKVSRQLEVRVVTGAR